MFIGFSRMHYSYIRFLNTVIYMKKKTNQVVSLNFVFFSEMVKKFYAVSFTEN